MRSLATMSKVACFLPLRKGSERVINKNTRDFAGIKGGLLALKMSQLIETRLIDEIVVSTNDEACIEIANQFVPKDARIRVIHRPEHLCLSSTNLVDLIDYVPTITDCEHILWTHVTVPFADASDYDASIEAYHKGLDENYDSLMSCSVLQNYLFHENGELVNGQPGRWPRTQDLDKIYELNHAVFLTSRETYLHQHNRIGNKPLIFEMDKIKSIDVDWEEDFLLAEAVYDRFKK